MRVPAIGLNARHFMIWSGVALCERWLRCFVLQESLKSKNPGRWPGLDTLFYVEKCITS